MSRIVVIDDDRSVREALRMVFKDGHQVALCDTGEAGLAELHQAPADLVFLDILLGQENGIEVLRQLRGLPDPPVVVMVTATRTVKTAVEAIKLGAFEYITKPWDLDELKLVAQRALDHQQQQRDLAELRRQVEESKAQFTRRLEQQVAERTAELEESNRQLLETRDQLLRSEKLASLGELIAGVAHELNNKLSPVVAYAQLLEEADVRDEERRFIRTIANSAEDATSVVRALLSFSRQSEPVRRQVQLNEVLADTLVLVTYHLKSGAITLEQQLEADLPAIMADDKQLGQVFLNITNNACQAMEERGGLLRIHSWSDADHVHFEFHDTGPGIAPEQLNKVFDPFFTTKPAGKGTGLGLSVSYGIIKAHGGDIQVESTPGQGTAFHISLPRVTVEAEIAEHRPERPEPPPNCTGRVLVIDDDAECRRSLQDILCSQHKVDVAADTTQGREHLRANPAYDAILLDCRMAGETGMAFYEWMRSHVQALADRCVFITGDYGKPDIIEFLNATGRPWLPKPFEVEKVRDVVAASMVAA